MNEEYYLDDVAALNRIIRAQKNLIEDLCKRIRGLESEVNRYAEDDHKDGERIRGGDGGS